jgi:hypothetical protein
MEKRPIGTIVHVESQWKKSIAPIGLFFIGFLHGLLFQLAFSS